MESIKCQLSVANVAATSGKLRTLGRTRTFAPRVEPEKFLPFTRFTGSVSPGTATTREISLRRLTKKVSRFSRGRESANIRIA